MNKEIMRAAGFDKEVALVNERKCPLCKKSVDASELKDSSSRREFMISGLCQNCQDEIFG